MFVFAQLNALGLDANSIITADEETLATVREEIFGTLCSEIDNESGVENDFRCSYPDDLTKAIRFGEEAPAELSLKATNWNNDIRKMFHRNLRAVVNHFETKGEYPVDTLSTHELLLAVKELDNRWSRSSTHGVYADNGCGFPYFRCTMNEEQLVSIVTHPEEWVFVELPAMN